MAKHYKEKHLQATNYKIENVKREENFILRNIWKVIGFGVVFTFSTPLYRSRDSYGIEGKSISEIGNNYSYAELCLICGLTFTVLCILHHFSSKYQDNKKLKKLEKLKQDLELEIQGIN